MTQTFTEWSEASNGLCVQFDGELVEQGETNFQSYKVVDTKAFGRALLLDDCFQFTESDEHVYHEMLVHPAMFCVEKPQHVLIIGGGDYLAAREVMKHQSVLSCTIVEIDPAIRGVATKHFEHLLDGVHRHSDLNYLVMDGARYLRGVDFKFDAIFVDSTDEDYASTLFDMNFYRECEKHLREGGVLVTQNNVAGLHTEEQRGKKMMLREIFGIANQYSVPIPSYTFGPMVFTMAHKRLMDLRLQTGIKTKYYTPTKFLAARYLADGADD